MDYPLPKSTRNKLDFDLNTTLNHLNLHPREPAKKKKKKKNLATKCFE